MTTLTDTELVDLKIQLDDTQILNDLRVMIPNYSYDLVYAESGGVYYVSDVNYQNLLYTSIEQGSINKYGRRSKINKYQVMDEVFQEAWCEAQKQKYAEPVQKLSVKMVGSDDANIIKALTLKVAQQVDYLYEPAGLSAWAEISSIVLEVNTDGMLRLELNLTDNVAIETPVVPPDETSKTITSFKLNGLSPVVTGIINQTAHTVTLTVPYGTTVTALIPTISITGASVSPESGVAGDFTTPQTYTVTANDASTQEYVVTVVVSANTDKAITAFNFNLLVPVVTGIINEGTHTIALTVPYRTVVTALIPTISISGASVNPASDIANNFTTPRTYIVTAGDATTQSYVATVTRDDPDPPPMYGVLHIDDDTVDDTVDLIG
jgi:hypothetical protein